MSLPPAFERRFTTCFGDVSVTTVPGNPSEISLTHACIFGHLRNQRHGLGAFGKLLHFYQVFTLAMSNR